jgi:hypothetical protein
MKAVAAAAPIKDLRVSEVRLILLPPFLLKRTNMKSDRSQNEKRQIGSLGRSKSNRSQDAEASIATPHRNN